MRKLIKNYQENGNNEVIERILNYADTDLTKYGYDEGQEMTDVDGLIYIAIKIRAYLLKECFRERNNKHFYNSSEQDKADYQALFYEKDRDDIYDEDSFRIIEDWTDDGVDGYQIDLLSDDSWIDDFKKKPWLGVDVDEFRNYNFKSIWNNRTKLTKYYLGQSHELFYLCKKFMKLSQHSWEFEQDFTETKEKLLPFFVGALEYALSKVDASRDDKEIVSYINMAMMTKMVEIKTQDEGLKRVREKGKAYYVHPTFENDVMDADNKIWMMLIGKSLAYVGADAFDEYLTKSQKEFLNELYNAVNKEYQSKNVEFFNWSKDGQPYLNKRRLAEKIGVNEASLKQKLKRVEDKFHSNWMAVFKRVLDNKAV